MTWSGVDVGAGVDAPWYGGTGAGVDVVGDGGTGAGVDAAGGGGVGVGASLAAGVTGAVVASDDAAGPQAAVSSARTDIMRACTDDLETVLIVNPLLHQNNRRLRQIGRGCC